MQLDASQRMGSIRKRLSAAACVLIAAGTPAMARPDSAATTQIDATGLLYGEANRTNVVEPAVRVTRLFPNGQSLSAQFELDVMTGASPTGAMPSGQIQTTTSASGTTTTLPAGGLPMSTFQDLRGAFDLEWQRPLGPITTTAGGHFSREKDYQSLGLSGQLSIDLFSRLTTLTLGGGLNRDGVFPVSTTASNTPGGDDARSVFASPVPSLDHSAPLAVSADDGQVRGPTRSKHVTSALIGISQVLSRRWLMSVNASRTLENGYLTEPYKMVSLLDDNGDPASQIGENRPDHRHRTDVLAGSVYHLTKDVIYSSYRYYWDDWGVRSHTYDLKYRFELTDQRYVQPHVRYYVQSAADFFRFGVIHGPPVPEFVSSDARLGPLHSATIGATYGFQIPNYPGEFSVRAEYLRQWGDGHPKGAVGNQRQFDLFPPVSIGSLLIGYSVGF